MRRALTLALLAALAAVPTAASALRPIHRTFGELTFPRVRAGHITVPNQRDRNVRVIVTLKLPPLAQAYGRGLFAAGSTRQLDAHTAAARAYLARLTAAQNLAIAQLKRAIPSARVSWRYGIVLDGFTVTLPPNRLPTLSAQSFAARVFPSLSYALTLNRSPTVIGADVFHATTGANGEGVKIGIVDDGVDNTNPFLSGTGFTAPAGFPIGLPQFTSAKVIVARVPRAWLG